MRFTALYPLHSHRYDPDILDPANVAAFARTAESAGFDAVALTEHPAPSQRWLDVGGHDALDVFTMLGFCAAVTSRVALMPYVLVLPFRNPVMAAKQVATLDVLSGGRVVLPVGTGYLRSEAVALGSDFGERNELFDEAVDTMRAIWAGEDVTVNGRHFDAVGITARPKPVQRPHPPLWIGGNSKMARERVARWGEGWTPILHDEHMARTTRTAPLPTLGALAEAVADLHRRLEHAGRDPVSVTVQLQGGGGRLSKEDQPLAEFSDWLDEVGAAGVDQLIVEVPARARPALDSLVRFGEEVIAPRGGPGGPTAGETHDRGGI
ncbi:MAG TPA: LLM class F420-dependent oxidoreductase [Acidimicrobiales bacterium]|nr:LLM class F420-dependent oxidoreductase [Acidimicrobiales bacterium]